MLPVISEVATHKKHSSKNLKISRKIRTNHRECSVKIDVLKSFANFTENACVGGSLQRYKPKTSNIIKKRL